MSPAKFDRGPRWPDSESAADFSRVTVRWTREGGKGKGPGQVDKRRSSSRLTPLLLCSAAVLSFSLFTGEQKMPQKAHVRGGEKSDCARPTCEHLSHELFWRSFCCCPSPLGITFPPNSSGNFCRYPVSRLLARLSRLFSWEQTVAVCLASVLPSLSLYQLWWNF